MGTDSSSYTVKKNELIGTIEHDCPKAIELLIEYGLSCIHCFLNQYETLEQGARTHGMSDQDIERMVEEVNEQLKTEPQS